MNFELTKRVVVKVGSSLVTNDGRGVAPEAIARFAAEIAALKARGLEVILVTSGATAEGMKRLGWEKRPKEMYLLQAAAAVGQMGLAQAYETAFEAHGIRTAQILLIHEDLSDRRRYLNARTTLSTLLRFGVLPVINENDTVATDEYKIGDNDTLSALVANLMVADLLVLLTDQSGLFTADPRRDPTAKKLDTVEAGDPALEALAGGAGTQYGKGGMLTKVLAAKRAARSGASTIVASGREPKVLTRLFDGEKIGTLFTAKTSPLIARKQWLADQLQVAGTLTVDDGAAKALTQDGKSLLPIGVVEVTGDFDRGEVVSVVAQNGTELARGLVNYNAQDCRKIRRQPTHNIGALLGHAEEPELIHRDNLVLLKS